MAIDESSVSVLIPAFGRREMTLAAVASCLATGAGEIVVSLDTDPDGAELLLCSISDHRLRVVVQKARLGLWRNHLALLRACSLPFVKFLQTDDRILPGGLQALCRAMNSKTAVVSSLPIYEDLGTGARWTLETPSQPGRWSSPAYLERAEIAGNELGRPSYTLFRRDAIELDEGVWRDDVSVDWLMNIVAASRGDVELLAPGAILCGIHAEQDSVTQGPGLTTKRFVNTLERLRDCLEDPALRLVSYQALAGLVLMGRAEVGFVRRGRNPFYPGWHDDLRRLFQLIDWSLLRSTTGWANARRAISFRFSVSRKPLVATRQVPACI